MKTIAKLEKVGGRQYLVARRVSNAGAAHLVERDGWHYCTKEVARKVSRRSARRAALALHAKRQWMRKRGASWAQVKAECPIGGRV